MLYILNHSPYFYDLAALQRTVQHGDDLLLLSDGVIAALLESPVLRAFNASPLRIFALKNDIIARGLSAHVSDKVIIINYTDFVKLTEKQAQQITW